MALQTREEIEQVAEVLRKAADAIHERLMNAIINEEIEQREAQLIFNDEVLLRQQCNSLYIDAINCVVADLSQSQAAVTATINAAKKTIRTVQNITVFIDLVADLLLLAAAIYAAKPAPIVGALKEIKDDIAALPGQ
jgi:hypothetical protein